MPVACGSRDQVEARPEQVRESVVRGDRLTRDAGQVECCDRCKGEGIMWRTGNECRKCKGTGNMRALPKVKPVVLTLIDCEQQSLSLSQGEKA